MKLKKHTAAILIAALTVTSFPTLTMASTNSKLSGVKDKISSAKSQLAEGEKRESQLLAEIDDINGQIDVIENDIAELEQNIEEKQQEIAEAQQELDKTQEDMDAQNEALNKRLRVMYKSGETGMLEVLLGSTSISDFLSNVDMIQKIYSNDKDILRQIKEQYDIIKEQKTILETLKNELQAEQDQQKEKQSDLEARITELEKLQKQVESDNKALEEQIDALNKEADSLTNMLRQEQAAAKVSSSTTSSYGGGIMAWPVPSSSRITSKYGYRNHPILKTNKFHSGLDIAATSGSPIVAASSGTVIMSKTNGGYGKCIMIDHGGGVVTLYGHCSSLISKVGDKVSKGQTIAKVGSTGQSTGPHCHFEVRINGSTTDPTAYL